MIFCRVFPFLASAALCLSLLTVFAQDAAAIVSNLTATRKDNDTITITWTYSEVPVANSFNYNKKGTNTNTSLDFPLGVAGENTHDVQISGLNLSADAEVRFKILGFRNGGIYFNSSWSGYISTGPLSWCSSQSGTDLQADCAVLENLYDSAGGANWSNKTNWKTANSLNTWHGVTVSNGRVSAIRLYENALTGTIPDLSSLSPV